MPTLPWTALARGECVGEYVVVATRFELTSRLHLGRIFSAARALISTFRATPGLIGYSLRASIVGRSLWTLSAWNTQSEMRQFVSGAAHTMTVNATAQWMRASTFTTWAESAGSPVPSWEKAIRLLGAQGARTR